MGERELFPDLMDQLYLFYSALLLTSVVMTISSYNPIYSIFWLVIVFLQSSILVISMGYEFVALILVIIYVGAVAILFLFVVMMLDVIQLREVANLSNILPIIALLLLQLTFSYRFYNTDASTTHLEQWFTNKEPQMLVIGRVLYNDLGIIFMLVSLILLIAMVGTIVLTLEVTSVAKKQSLKDQHQRNNSWT